MKDKCCRHKRLLSHDCVKCIKYKGSKQLKRSLLNEQLKLSILIEVKCIHGNDSNKCEKCLIQDSDKMLCIHGNSSKCEKCLRLKNNGIAKENNMKKINDEMLCIHGRILNTCGTCIRRTNEKMKRKVTISNSNIKLSNVQMKRKSSKFNDSLNICDNFCEHFESVELCKECLQNTKLHQDPVDFMDNIGIFLIYNYNYYLLLF